MTKPVNDVVILEDCHVFFLLFGEDNNKYSLIPTGKPVGLSEI